jgi:DNA-binding NtrC family response regulator
MKRIAIVTKDNQFAKKLSENNPEYSFTLFGNVFSFEKKQQDTKGFLYVLVEYLDFSSTVEVEKFISKVFPCKVIFISDYCNSIFMSHALRCGAFYYIEKSLCTKKFLQSLEKFSEDQKNEQTKAETDEITILENKCKITEEEEEILSQFIGESPESQLLKNQMMCFAKSSFPVLITGDSGTGKTLCAKLIHKLSERNDKSFVKINCAGIPSSIAESELFGAEKGAFTDAVKHTGKFVEADGGTLFLDEIGAMEKLVQPKGLLALEDKVCKPVGSNKEVKFDARIICATNSDLEKERKKGKFRSDLYYRISTLELKLLPLRQRKKDIIPLAQNFLKDTKKHLSAEAEKVLLEYSWPGNVRELNRVIQRSLLYCSGDEITEKEINLSLK